MEFDNDNGETWKWQDMDCSLPEGPRYDISPWTEVTTNQEDMSYMIDDTTPVKACVDVSCKVSDCDDLIKESEECRVSSSQAKRRRMLLFTNEPIEFPLCTEDLPSAYLKSKAREESVESLFPELSPWDDTSSDFMSTSNSEMMEPDEWLAELFNDTDMNPEDMTFLEEASVQYNISDFGDAQHNHKAEAPPVECCALPPKPAPKKVTGRVIFKGRRSYIQPPIKLASSVAYPFTFIKPCPAKGGMTLDDINQKIHTPPPKKPDPIPPNLPKSAFSGKLVVGKTRIRTEGGKGSITITRTRG
uniref:Protein XRI1 n=1 Tax=Kalanchoe fedtschenkoi TaxID=63787 RepID=A0A7N0UI81_KALFE